MVLTPDVVARLRERLSRMRPSRVVGTALAASLVLMAGCGTEEAGDKGADGPTSAPTQTTPASPLDFGKEPRIRPRYKKAALRAVGDDLITMVPAPLPEEWTTKGGGYTADPQWWRMEFTAPTGDVVLDQLPGTSAEVLEGQPGLTPGDDVDLSDWGSGTWSSWTRSGATVMAYDVKGSTVILQGPDLETLRVLAGSLLPAEDAGEQDG
jgi:hypothetical protein